MSINDEITKNFKNNNFNSVVSFIKYIEKNADNLCNVSTKNLRKLHNKALTLSITYKTLDPLITILKNELDQRSDIKNRALTFLGGVLLAVTSQLVYDYVKSLRDGEKGKESQKKVEDLRIQDQPALKIMPNEE